MAVLFDSVETEQVRIPSEMYAFDSFHLTRSTENANEFVAFGYPTDGPIQEVDVVKVRFGADGNVRETTVYREYVGTDAGGAPAFSAAVMVPTGVFGAIALVDTLLSDSPRFALQAWKTARAEPMNFVWLVVVAFVGIGIAPPSTNRAILVDQADHQISEQCSVVFGELAGRIADDH